MLALLQLRAVCTTAVRSHVRSRQKACAMEKPRNDVFNGDSVGPEKPPAVARRPEMRSALTRVARVARSKLN